METATSAPPAKDHSQTALQGGQSGKSALGSSSEIADRLKDFVAKKPETTGDKPSSGEIPLKKAPEKTEKDTQTPEKPDPTKDKVGTDGLTREERAQVVEMKKRAEAAEARVKDYETTVAEREAAQKELKELKEWRAKIEPVHERNEKEIAAIRVQQSTKYQDSIARPMQALTQTIEEIAKSVELDADAVFNAIGNRDLVKRNAAISEYLTSMDPLTQDTFKRAVNDLLDLEPKAQKIIKEAQESWQAVQLEEKKAAEEKSRKEKETYAKASDAVWDVIAENYPFLNEDETREYIRGKADSYDFDNAPADVKAYFAQSGYAMVKVQKVIEARDQKIKELEESVKRLQGSKAGMHTGSPAPAKAERETVNGSTPGDRFKSWLTNA
jgi:hypothetical protein